MAGIAAMQALNEGRLRLSRCLLGVSAVSFP
jgi:hypothetical protein